MKSKSTLALAFAVALAAGRFTAFAVSVMEREVVRGKDQVRIASR